MHEARSLLDRLLGRPVTRLSAEALAGQLDATFANDNIGDAALLNSRLAQVALYDQLTGAGSRTLFEHRTDLAIDAARVCGTKLAVLFVDLDKFKQVNDRFGHDVGDALLCAFAGRLSDALGPGKLLARLGGDEFAILVERVADLDEGLSLAASVTSSLETPFELNQRRHTLSASIGIAMYPDHGETEKLLLRHADLDMYRAKGHRRREPDLLHSHSAALLLRERVLASIRPALELGQFIPYYQPVIALASREVLELEVLLRWQKGHDEVWLPREFLSVLDETGMIIPVGRGTLFEACRQLPRFQLVHGAACRLSLNVTAVELGERHFAQRVLEILAARGVAPSRLQLEVGESVLASESLAIDEALRVLQTSGVSLCLDDFGVGTSSLTQLRRARVQGLKIHRTIIADVHTNPESEAIVRATLAIARSLDLHVVALGVENEAQHVRLTELGCSAVQGSFYAAPMPADAVRHWLRA